MQSSMSSGLGIADDTEMIRYKRPIECKYIRYY